MWDLNRAAAPLLVLHGHSGHVQACAVVGAGGDAAGDHVVSGGADGCVRLWDARAAPAAAPPPPSAAAAAAAGAGSGPSRPQRVSAHTTIAVPARVAAVAAAPSSHLVFAGAEGAGGVLVYDTRALRLAADRAPATSLGAASRCVHVPVATLPQQPGGHAALPVAALALSPAAGGGTYLAAASDDGAVCVRGVDEAHADHAAGGSSSALQCVYGRRAHTDYARALAWVEGGGGGRPLLVSGGWDGRVVAHAVWA